MSAILLRSEWGFCTERVDRSNAIPINGAIRMEHGEAEWWPFYQPPAEDGAVESAVSPPPLTPPTRGKVKVICTQLPKGQDRLSTVTTVMTKVILSLCKWWWEWHVKYDNWLITITGNQSPILYTTPNKTQIHDIHINDHFHNIKIICYFH